MKYIITLLIVFIGFFANAQDKKDHYQLFIDALEEGNAKTALSQINKAIKNNPDSLNYKSAKAFLLYEMRDMKGALILYNEIIETNPTMSDYSGRGIVYESLMFYDEAVEDYKSAVKIAPNDTMKYMLYSNIASAKMRTREFDVAYSYLMKSYNFDSTNLVVLNNLGTVCDEIGRGDETVKYLSKVLEIDPTFIGGWVNLGFKMQMLEKYELSLKYFNKALEINPEEPLSYNNRGYSLYKLERYKEALKDVNKSIDLYPGNSYAYRNRALIYIATGKTKKACEDIDFAINQNFVQSYGDEILEMKKENCN